jgi:hypothetical protein
VWRRSRISLLICLGRNVVGSSLKLNLYSKWYASNDLEYTVKTQFEKTCLSWLP